MSPDAPFAICNWLPTFNMPPEILTLPPGLPSVSMRTGKVKVPLSILKVEVPVPLPTVLSKPYPLLQVRLGALVALPKLSVAPPVRAKPPLVRVTGAEDALSRMDQLAAPSDERKTRPPPAGVASRLVMVPVPDRVRNSEAGPL